MQAAGARLVCVGGRCAGIIGLILVYCCNGVLLCWCTGIVEWACKLVKVCSCFWTACKWWVRDTLLIADIIMCVYVCVKLLSHAHMCMYAYMNVSACVYVWCIRMCCAYGKTVSFAAVSISPMRGRGMCVHVSLGVRIQRHHGPHTHTHIRTRISLATISRSHSHNHTHIRARIEGQKGIYIAILGLFSRGIGLCCCTIVQRTRATYRHTSLQLTVP